MLRWDAVVVAPLSRGGEKKWLCPVPSAASSLAAQCSAWLYHCAPRIGDGRCGSFFYPPPRHGRLLTELDRESFLFAFHFWDFIPPVARKGDADKHLPRRTSANGLLRLWQIVIQEFQQPPTPWSVSPPRGDHIGGKYPGPTGLFNLDIVTPICPRVMYVEIKHATDGWLNHKRAILSHYFIYSQIITELFSGVII